MVEPHRPVLTMNKGACEFDMGFLTNCDIFLTPRSRLTKKAAFQAGLSFLRAMNRSPEHTRVEMAIEILIQ